MRAGHLVNPATAGNGLSMILIARKLRQYGSAGNAYHP
jgi:hypothetical protein